MADSTAVVAAGIGTAIVIVTDFAAYVATLIGATIVAMASLPALVAALVGATIIIVAGLTALIAALRTSRRTRVVIMSARITPAAPLIGTGIVVMTSLAAVIAPQNIHAIGHNGRCDSRTLRRLLIFCRLLNFHGLLSLDHSAGITCLSVAHSVRHCKSTAPEHDGNGRCKHDGKESSAAFT